MLSISEVFRLLSPRVLNRVVGVLVKNEGNGAAVSRPPDEVSPDLVVAYFHEQLFEFRDAAKQAERGSDKLQLCRDL